MPSKGNLIIGDGNTIKTGSANNVVTGGGNTVGCYVSNGLIIGNKNIIGSTTAAIESRNTGAVVLGTNGSALRLGETVINSGGLTSGSAQSSVVTMIKTIPAGTSSYQECFIHGQATNTGRIVLPDNSCTGFRVRSSAFLSGTGGFFFELSGAIERGSGAASTQILDPSVSTKSHRYITGKTNQWRAQASADTSNGSLKIEVKTNASLSADVDFMVIVELFQAKA